MIMTPSKLRGNIYNILDKVLETGIPVEIQRRGKILCIMPPAGKKYSKLSKLKKRDVLVGDPEDIVHMDWSSEWKG